jgi:polar amino acid transport system substrate-binding protein
MHPDLPQLFAPHGRLRAAINLGNPLLARRAADGSVHGVSVDLAGELARRLGVPLELVVFDKAAQSVAAIEPQGASDAGVADIGFFAIDPERAAAIAFTAAYMLIEGSYLVRADSPVRDNDGVDQPGHTVVVGHGSAYDLFLSRQLRHAAIVRAPSSQEVVAQFLATGATVAAGVRQQLEMDTAGTSGVRLLDGRFMTIAQAMGTARQRGPVAQAFLHDFVETMKASGFVQDAMTRHGVAGASVAPAQTG